MPDRRIKLLLKLIAVIGSLLIALVGWGAVDRLAVENRLTAAENRQEQIVDLVREINRRLDRIENKLDRAIEREIIP